jgi:glutamate-5-semialdehyde dehydrogenase
MNQADMMEMGQHARAAADELRNASAEMRTRAIQGMARAIRRHAVTILEANQRDMAGATAHHDRLRLDEQRLEGIASALETVAGLPDPVGAETARWQRPNGLDIARVRVPIGVIGMIYESRPNVTADAAAICIRSGNAIILRSGSEALHSSLAIHAALAEGLEEAGLSADCVQIVRTPDREAVGTLLGGLNGAIDLIIPRGGRGWRAPRPIRSGQGRAPAPTGRAQPLIPTRRGESRLRPAGPLTVTGCCRIAGRRRRRRR